MLSKHITNSILKCKVAILTLIFNHITSDTACLFFCLVCILVIWPSHFFIPPQINWVVFRFNLWVSRSLISRMKTVAKLVVLKIESINIYAIDLSFGFRRQQVLSTATLKIIPLIWFIIKVSFLLFDFDLSVVVWQILWLLLFLLVFFYIVSGVVSVAQKLLDKISLDQWKYKTRTSFFLHQYQLSW